MLLCCEFCVLECQCGIMAGFTQQTFSGVNESNKRYEKQAETYFFLLLSLFLVNAGNLYGGCDL